MADSKGHTLIATRGLQSGQHVVACSRCWRYTTGKQGGALEKECLGIVTPGAVNARRRIEAGRHPQGRFQERIAQPMAITGSFAQAWRDLVAKGLAA